MIFKYLSSLATIAIFSLACSTGLASDIYPSRSIKLVIPFAPGGQSDVVGRLVAQRLSTGLGQSMVVDNLVGAGGMIAANSVTRAAPDGYTLFLPNASTLTIVPNLQKKVMITPESFTPISAVSQFPLVLVVNSNSSFRSLNDIIAAAKTKPGKVSIASPGYGTTPHLVAETLMRDAKIDMTHVPYKGGAPAINAVLAGEVDAFFEAPSSVLPHVQSGKLRALAVTGKSRMKSLPEIRTLAELGMPDLTLESWSAIVAPAGTPPEIVRRLRSETEKILKSEEFINKLRELGFEADSSTSEELARTIRDDYRKWAKLIKDRNITVD